MNYSERLEGTRLEGNRDAKVICGVLDWMSENDITVSVSHRSWAQILGYGKTGSSRARNMLKALAEEGVIEIAQGKGRSTDKVSIPQNGNTPADKKAAFMKRKEEWKKLVIENLEQYVKDNDWNEVKDFFEFWSEDVGGYTMMVEKEKERLSKDGKTFSIRKRFVGWKNNAEKIRMKYKPSGKSEGTGTEEMTLSAIRDVMKTAVGRKGYMTYLNGAEMEIDDEGAVVVHCRHKEIAEFVEKEKGGIEKLIERKIKYIIK